MSLDLCVLGSGSAGNSTLVRGRCGTILIDIGFGPRATAARLAGSGAGVDDIAAICLTHIDRDHFNPNWINTILRRNIRLHCHAGLVEPILAIVRRNGLKNDRVEMLQPLIRPFEGDAFQPVDGVDVQPIGLPHDQAGSHGFLICQEGCRVGYATDLGSVPPGLFELFEDLDVLAMESNYDPQMQMDSDRPWVLKHRVMGGSGHLSNQQSFAAVRHILNRCEKKGSPLPSHIVLLHRSRQCNCPDLVRDMFRQDARIAERLILTEQDERTGWIRARRDFGEQARAASHAG